MNTESRQTRMKLPWWRQTQKAMPSRVVGKIDNSKRQPWIDRWYRVENGATRKCYRRDKLTIATNIHFVVNIFLF